jgi:hypothetical protein
MFRQSLCLQVQIRRGGRAKTALIPRNFGVVLTKIKFKIGDKTYFEGNVNMGEFFEINADRDAFDG